jgi:hypothetical protein
MSQDAVSGPTEVDWDAAVRSERRLDALLMLSVLAAMSGYVLLRDDPATSAGRLRVLVGAVIFAVFVAHRLGLIRLRGEPGRADVHRVRRAVRAHVDPGPALRKHADSYAERQSLNPLFWFSVPFAGVQILNGRWDHPLASGVASVLLVSGIVGSLLWLRPMTAAGRRWLDNPPGREHLGPYVSRPDQRPWTISARQGVVLALLLTATVAAVAAAILTLG